MYPCRHSDGQLSEGGCRLQAAAQRSPGQRRPQVRVSSRAVSSEGTAFCHTAFDSLSRLSLSRAHGHGSLELPRENAAAAAIVDGKRQADLPKAKV